MSIKKLNLDSRFHGNDIIIVDTECQSHGRRGRLPRTILLLIHCTNQLTQSKLWSTATYKITIPTPPRPLHSISVCSVGGGAIMPMLRPLQHRIDCCPPRLHYVTHLRVTRPVRFFQEAPIEHI